MPGLPRLAVSKYGSPISLHNTDWLARQLVKKLPLARVY
jgi:hypothetical protein